MKLNYEIKKKMILHPTCDCYEVFFKNESDLIYADLFLPKKGCSKIVFEVPDYMAFPKDLLNLSRYALLDYGVVSLHLRGQRGKSENSTSFTQYSPFDFKEEHYFLELIEDLKILNFIIDENYPNLKKVGVGVGLGASLLTHIEAELNCFEELYISNILLADFDYIIDNNKDINFYTPIRYFLQNHPSLENELKEGLRKLDVVEIGNKIKSKVYYGLSFLDEIAPYETQLKFVGTIRNVEVLKYRKFGHEVLQEHFFDEFILEKLK